MIFLIPIIIIILIWKFWPAENFYIKPHTPVIVKIDDGCASRFQVLPNRFYGQICECGDPGYSCDGASTKGVPDSRDLQYHDWMRYLEFDAQKEIAGCNSPPPIMELLYG